RRLWSETRVALFETSVDSRNLNHRETGHQPRVFFGDEWVTDSVLDLFRDNISHFRVIVVGDDDPESSRLCLEQGRLPKLSSLCLHSGTVYRWNRPCYGVSNGIAHLRIENRVLPSGPTPLDEMANAAFFFGLMIGLADEVGPIDRVMRFDDAKSNFFAAARHGLDAQMRWTEGKCFPASTLILEHLLPIAWSGLARMNVNPNDIDRYLGVLRERIESERTGARWVYDSLAAMGEYAPEVRFQALTDAIRNNQQTEKPVHHWPLASVTEGAESWRQSFATAGQVMSTHLFSVRPEDILDLPANLMDWHQVRHVPVEDEQGRLIGLVSHRAILRVFARGHEARQKEVLVRDVMREDPVTATMQTPTSELIHLMRRHKVSCLPIVGTNRRLVGLVTEQDLMAISSSLLERFLLPIESESKTAAAAPTSAKDSIEEKSSEEASTPSTHNQATTSASS
ncbi:MAG: CBS domain-containing protein, partial [Myxococcota bacterium]